MGGYTPRCLERCVELYSAVLDEVYPVSSCRVAEATKLTENIFRSVNIALVNELKIIYQKMSIDIWEVIEAAKTKPFGYMPFYPGPGLGGHCIPIDPFYLSWKAKQYGMEAHFIELAGEVNTSMPDYVIERLEGALHAQGKTIEGSKFLIVGLAYKPDVDDDRESPSYVLMEKLEAQGANVGYHDPHIPVIRPRREYSHFAGRESVEWNDQSVSTYDAAIISTAHSAVNHDQLTGWVSCIVDARNSVSKPSLSHVVWKA